jgi:uridine kinase
MVLDTPVTNSVVAYVVDLGPGLVIVVLPVVYSAILGLQYALKRGNPSLAVMCTCLALTSVALLSPASPGWFVWSVPFLAVLVSFAGIRTRALLYAFWGVASVTLAFRASGAVPRNSNSAYNSTMGFTEVGSFVNGVGVLGPILATATVGLGVVVLIMIFRNSMSLFNSYRLSTRPLSLAVAGDSGTGKDTLCVSLADVFGASATSFVMGDDYHLYDRKAPLWLTTTHLHPGANDLSTMARDVRNLLHGQLVWNKHYDHSRGTFSTQRKTEAREVVVVNGLHALAMKEVVDTVDLRVYMSMDEGLRRRLKINRDVGERGQSIDIVTQSIERRYEHTARYVAPQRDVADVVFHLESAHDLAPENELAPVGDDFRLTATLREATFAVRLQAAFVALGNCQAWLEYLDVPGGVRLRIYPSQLSARDITGIAGSLIERDEELFTSVPRWSGGSSGAIQLITILSLLDRRRSGKGFAG